MENIFRKLLKDADIPAYQVAEKLEMSPNTVSRLVSKDGYPDTAQIRTLNRFARYFGYRVKVELEKVKETENAQNSV